MNIVTAKQAKEQGIEWWQIKNCADWHRQMMEGASKKQKQRFFQASVALERVAKELKDEADKQNPR